MRLRRILEVIGIDHTNNTVAIATDDLCQLLAARRRRLVIEILQKRDEDEIRLDELARLVAARETDAAPLEVTESEYEARYVALYQSHLPQLDDADVVSWDRERGIVQEDSSFAPIATIVEAIDRWTTGDDCE